MQGKLTPGKKTTIASMHVKDCLSENPHLPSMIKKGVYITEMASLSSVSLHLEYINISYWETFI